MKKALAAFVLFLGLSAHAGEQPIGGQWLGLHNSDTSMAIGDNEAQDLLNVDITDSGLGIRKRYGYSQFRTVGVSTHGVRGAHYFTDTSGNKTLIHCNDRDCWESVNSAAYTQFITTDTSGSYYDWSDSNGSAWRATNNRDEFLAYNGTTKTYYPSLPKGNQLEFTPDRLVISGTSANPNRLHFSKKSDPTTFTTAAEAADPFTTDVALPGTEVTAIKWYQDRLLFWTRDAIGYWYGSDQYNQGKGNISNTVGTDQPYSVNEDLGYVYWQAQDRHFYRTDGSSVEKISGKLDVSGFASGETRDWEQTTQADWEAGTVGTGLSTSYSAGDILLSTGTLIDAFADGDYTSNPTWTSISSGFNASVSGGRFLLEGTLVDPTSADMGIYTAVSASTGSWAVNFESNAADRVAFIKISTGVPGDASYENTNSYTLTVEPGSTNNLFIYRNSVKIATGSVTVSGGTAYTLELNRQSNGDIRAYINASLVVSVNDTNYSSFTYVTIGMITESADGLCSVYLDNIYTYPSVGVFQSQSFNIGTGITSWGTFSVNNVLNGGSISYALYGDTDTATTPSDATTYTSSQTITNGSIPTIATAAYVVVGATFTRTVSTQTPTINDFSLQWNEGTLSKTLSVVDKDHRIMWAVAEGTSTIPTATYIYDPRFDSWLKYDVPFQAAARVGDDLYFGGVSTGVVYQWPSGNTDNGSAITAYWKSKDFVAPSPFLEKDYTSVSLVAKTQAGSNLDITTTVNTATSSSDNISLTESNGYSLVRYNENLASGTQGTFFNFKFGNDDGDAPFEVYIAKFDFQPLEWRVLP